MSDIVIKVDHLSKTFHLPHERTNSIKSAVVNFYKRKKTFEEQSALKDISFEVRQGEFFGIVGRNGSGKSTLLKILAKIYVPSTGSVSVNGSLTPFIELGVGFNPELTGRENIFLNGALLGFNHKEMQAMYKDIVEFAELSRFMDQKLKNYSSGMQVRLAFSIATRVNSDILLLDEVLAVGDSAFQKKCYDYFMLLKKNKKTVVLVTHDMNAVRQYCDRAIVIKNGRIEQEGDPETIAQAYQRLFLGNDSSNDSEGSSERWGNGKLRSNKPLITVNEEGIVLKMSFTAKQDLAPPIYGFTIYDSSGANLVEGNTLRSKRKTEKLKKGQTTSIEWKIPNIFKNGAYKVSVACCDQSATEFYDWFNEAASFRINKDSDTAGVVNPQLSIKLEHGV
jgi:ABC-2 type transport system ATP-binding protein